MFYDRKTVKARARESLRGVTPRPWQLTLLYWLLAALIPSAIALILQLVSGGGFFAMLQEAIRDPMGFSVHVEAMNTEELLGYYRSLYLPAPGAGIISTFITILVGLFRVVMQYGYANYTLKLYRGEATGKGDIFSGFPVAGRAIGAGIVVYIFEFLWTLLAVVLAICATVILAVAIAALGDSVALTVLMVLLIVAAWVAAILFSMFIGYRYCLTPYFILTTDMGVMEAVRASKESMRGNIGRRFVLDLSFIGWELVNGLIAMGVMLVGYFILVFAVTFFTIFGLDAEQVESGYISDEYANDMVRQMMIQIFAGAGVLTVLSELATLPLGLWLAAYRGSAQAGFFLAVTGQEAQPVIPTPPAYIPPQPSDVWDNVPPPPSFTDPNPPAAEEPPVVEEQPPVAEEQPPVVEEQPPVVEEQPPVVEEQPPVVEEQPPVAEAEPETPSEEE